MTVAVQAGTTGEAWARENLPEATIVPLASVTVCMTGVSTGQYQAFCTDLPVIGHQCTVSFTDCEIALEIPTGEQYGIVVSKDNPGLTAAINKALADMEADDPMDDVKAKWVGE
jgi:polar amino acid transport system substrate-binding protein